MNIASKSLVLFMLGFFMSGCAGQTSFRMPTVPLLSTDNESAQAINTSRSLLGERRIAETSEFYVPSISAIGFSSVSIQPSKNINQRRLMAMRAAKLDAYRSLTEQIHGIRVEGETTIGEAVLTSDKLAAALNGLIIGARTVKIEPTSNDTYQVELAVSETHINRLVKAYRKGLL
ncbi:MAG: hypothetical protein VW712_09455 [Paracoccaceae bacterium]|jgi:hypothetical protein